MNIAVQKSVYGGSQFIFLYVSFTPITSRIIYTIPSRYPTLYKGSFRCLALVTIRSST